MTSRTRSSASPSPIIHKFTLPAEPSEELRQAAKITGLATSQLVRSLVLNYLAKIHAPTEGNR